MEPNVLVVKERKCSHLRTWFIIVFLSNIYMTHTAMVKSTKRMAKDWGVGDYREFSYGSLLMDWAARGEPTIFHAPVSEKKRNQRAAALKRLWWEDTY